MHTTSHTRIRTAPLFQHDECSAGRRKRPGRAVERRAAIREQLAVAR